MLPAYLKDHSFSRLPKLYGYPMREDRTKVIYSFKQPFRNQ